MTSDALFGKNAQSGLLLYAKQSGLTSFASLGCIKKALHTKKVGHTGTLDSFAEGLLVVLTGNLTRLVPYFTLFDKTYEAVFSFGKETDTLDPEGTVVRSAPLPALKDFECALSFFCGNFMQTPPAYSAVHVNGRRASDLARAGKLGVLPERPVSVYKNKILEIRLAPDKRVCYARVLFHVSKGTYIRSLARDVGRFCSSAAYLIGLKRTKVGCFYLEQAAFADMLEDFTIESVIRRFEKPVESDECGNSSAGKGSEFDHRGEDETIRRVLMNFDPDTAGCCGFIPLKLHRIRHFDFMNGKVLKPDFFENFEQTTGVCKNQTIYFDGAAGKNESTLQNTGKLNFAVFLQDGTFVGIIQGLKNEAGACKKLTYGFVTKSSSFC